MPTNTAAQMSHHAAGLKMRLKENRKAVIGCLVLLCINVGIAYRVAKRMPHSGIGAIAACIVGLFVSEIIIAIMISYLTNASTMDVFFFGEDAIQLVGFLIGGIFHIISNVLGN